MQTVVERFVVPDTIIRTPPKSRRLIAFFCLLAVVLGATEAWLSRNDMYSDGISYMDIGDAVSRGQWGDVVNAYWSPLYPILLGSAAAVLKPSAEWQFAAVHLVNFLLYLAALACFHCFLSSFIRYTTDGRQDEVQTWWWIPVGYTLFLWTTLRLISANGEAEARTIAEAVLGEGPHHLGVELCLEGARLLSLGSVGAARPSSEGSSAA